MRNRCSAARVGRVVRLSWKNRLVVVRRGTVTPLIPLTRSGRKRNRVCRWLLTCRLVPITGVTLRNVRLLKRFGLSVVVVSRWRLRLTPIILNVLMISTVMLLVIGRRKWLVNVLVTVRVVSTRLVARVVKSLRRRVWILMVNMCTRRYRSRGRCHVVC